MSVDSKVEFDVLTIKILGRFDFDTHLNMREATNLVGEGIKNVVVDLSMTDYLDSSALGMLLVLRDRVSNDQGSIIIQGAKPEVKKILQIANFDKLFKII
jgi:anti-anti-sigma factor